MYPMGYTETKLFLILILILYQWQLIVSSGGLRWQYNAHYYM